MKTKLENLLEKTENFLNDLEPGQRGMWATLIREIKEEIDKEKTIAIARALRSEMKTLKEAMDNIVEIHGRNNAYYSRFLLENNLNENDI